MRQVIMHTPATSESRIGQILSSSTRPTRSSG
jgi:hypothetical protein